MSILRPCLGCGQPDPNTWCSTCRPPKTDHKTSSTRRGYDSTWQRLSQRARRLQPFCSDCGSRDDLTADHSRTAWERRAQGKAVRLQDVDVVCRGCNARRGRARPLEGNSAPRGGTPATIDADPPRQAEFGTQISNSETRLLGSDAGSLA